MATFSNKTPAPGTTVSTLGSGPSVVALTSPNQIAQHIPRGFWVDGVQYYASGSYITQYQETIRGYVSTDQVPDGVHTIKFSVTELLGAVTETSWSFTLQAPPTLSSLVPASGSTVPYAKPVIGLTLFDNTPGQVHLHLRVDGSLVYDAQANQGAFTYIPATAFLTNTTHAVVADVTDAAGNTASSSWTFNVVAGPPMDVTSSVCVECHTTFPGAHPTSNCLGCHNEHGDGDYCEDCHDQHAGDYMVDCRGCHVVDSFHGDDNHTTTTTGCTECHSTSLITEHGKYPYSDPFKYQCKLCHASAAPAVVAAIAGGRTDCGACHASLEHRAQHVSATSSGCFGVGCHPASKNLQDVHDLYAGTGSEHAQYANDCELCHANASVTLPTATNCTPACHSGSTHSRYSTKHTITSASAWCTSCHGTDLSGIHGAYADYSHCDWCHSKKDNWSKTADCASCHAGHPHAAADVTGLANGERQCSVCHSSDIVVEHSKPTSVGHENPCQTCHADGGAVDSLSGAWDGKCDNAACHGTGSGREVHANYCLACHDVAQPEFASSKTSFPDVAQVDRNTACKACHIAGLVGTHPYHQAGANCGAACHPGWGNSLIERTPTYVDPVSGASFADVTSKATPAALLHAIHAAPRWPSGVNTNASACSSCHATAACNACHTGAVPASHAAHSSSDQDANPAWTGLVSHGVVGGDQSQRTAFVDTNQCASTGCHNIGGAASVSSRLIEDYNYSVGGNPDDPTGTNTAVSSVGTWRYRASARYTGGRMSYNNVAGSSMSASFTGERVEIISDRDPYRGQADVYIDGVLAGSFDAYSAITRHQAVVFSADVESGSHTVSVRPTGIKGGSSRGAFVVVDAFRVYGARPQLFKPACSSCHTERATTHW